MGDLAAVNGFVWEHPDALTDYDEIIVGADGRPIGFGRPRGDRHPEGGD